MTQRAPSKRLIRSLLIIMLVLCTTVSIALAACPTSNEVQGKYEVCTSGCHTGDLLENSKCINSCIGQRMRDDSARYDCEKAERDAAALSAQERIRQQEAENAKLDAEQRARENGASWGAQHGTEIADIGDEASFVNGNVKLMRDGKIVPFTKGTKIGPADVLMTTGIGPVGVGSQVENIRYGKDTIMQRIGFLYNPPRLLEQPSAADAMRMFGVQADDEWSWWSGVGLDIGSIMVTRELQSLTPVCAKAFAAGQPEICGGILLGDIIVRGGMWYYSKLHADNNVQFVLTPSAAIMHRKTEFTLFVADDNATTVTVLNGSVIVMDMASRKGVILNDSQAITVPKTAAGLSADQLSQRIVTVDPAKVDKFEPRVAGAQAGAGAGTPITAKGVQSALANPAVAGVLAVVIFVIILAVVLLVRKINRKTAKPKKR